MDDTKKNIPKHTLNETHSPTSPGEISVRPLLPRHIALAGAGAGLFSAIAVTVFHLPFVVAWILISLVTALSINAMTKIQEKVYEKYLTHIEQENHGLEALRDEAEADSARKTEFMADMSRELRTPISVIMSLSRVSLRQNLPDAVALNLENILSSGKEVLETANDVLDFSKTELGQIEFTEARFSMFSLLSDVKETIKSKLEETNSKFVLEVDETMPNLLWGDETRFRQILLNMADIVLKQAEEGTLCLNIQWKKQKDMALLTIAFSISAPNTHEKEGEKTVPWTDLKLLIIKNLVEKMGGSILSENIHDTFPSFSVILPQKILQDNPTYNEARSRQRPAAPKSGNGEANLTFPGARVLVIDDSLTNLKLLKGLLAPYDMKAEYVLHAPECLERNWAKTYDLILLDYFMPELNGGEILKYLQKNPRFHTPVVALGTNAPDETKESCLSWGFSDFLAKPIQPEELENCLKQYLSAFLHNGSGTVPIVNEKIVFTLMPQADKEEKTPPVTTEEPIHTQAEKQAPIREESAPTQTGVDNDILNIALGIENTAGEESFYMEILELYLSQAEEKKELLQTYLDAGDMKNYAVQIHALKSTMRSMGAMKAGEFAFDLETHSKKDDLEYVREHHENAIKEAELAEENMRLYLSEKGK